MTTRQQRRQAERKARKAANKAQSQQPFTAPVTAAVTATASTTGEPLGVEPQFPRQPYTAIKRAEIIRANARNEAAPVSEPKFQSDEAAPLSEPKIHLDEAAPLSWPKMQTGPTGPRTSIGKETSSQNAIRHGLAGNGFRIFDWENADEYHALLANLAAEHEAATQTEVLLVEKMAQHFWLAQRAITLQDTCFTENGAYCDQQKDLALYMRYGATHDRVFHKCLSELLKLRAARAKEQQQFVSQQHREAAEIRKQEHHVAKLATLKPKFQPHPVPSASETVHSQVPAIAFNSPQAQTLAA